jgi:hypothetical protein
MTQKGPSKVNKLIPREACIHSYVHGANQIFLCETRLTAADLWSLDGQPYCLVHAPAEATNGPRTKREFAQAEPEEFQSTLTAFLVAQLSKIDRASRTLDLSGLVIPIDCDLGDLLVAAGAMKPGAIKSILLAHARFGDYLRLSIPVTLHSIILDDAVFEGRTDLSGWRASIIRARRVQSKLELNFSSPEIPLVCNDLDLSNLVSRGRFICTSACIVASLDLSESIFGAHSTFDISGTAATQISIARAKFPGGFDASRLRVAHYLNGSGASIEGFANFTSMRNISSIGAALSRYGLRLGLAPIDLRDYTGEQRGVDLCNVMFGAGVSFAGSRFGGPFDISVNRRLDAELLDANFSRVHFGAEATFRNRDLTGQVTFEDSAFLKAPSFAGTKLSRDTTFSNAKFHDISTREAESRYRLIRRELRESESTDDYELFVKLETDSRWARRGDLPLWETPVLFLFRNLFDYGADMGRALSVLLLNWTFGGAIYFASGMVIYSHYLCRSSESDHFCRVQPNGLFMVLLMAMRVSAHASLIPFSFLPNWPDVSTVAKGGHRVLLEWIVLAVGLSQSAISALLWLSVAWAITWKISKD